MQNLRSYLHGAHDPGSTLGLVLDSPAEERHGCIGGSPAKGYEDD